jgi:hypothetical protein
MTTTQFVKKLFEGTVTAEKFASLKLAWERMTRGREVPANREELAPADQLLLRIGDVYELPPRVLLPFDAILRKVRHGARGGRDAEAIGRRALLLLHRRLLEGVESTQGAGTGVRGGDLGGRDSRLE